MASVEGLTRKIKALKPKVQSAFVVYITPRDSPVNEVDPTFEVVEVTTPTDPLVDQIVLPWQRPYARKMLAEGRGRIIVATAEGKPIGRIWEIFTTERALFAGVPRVKLAPRESFMFDLFVEREYRRSNVGMTMADYFFGIYNEESEAKHIYGFISYENAPSILWHYSIGFNIVQTMNYLQIGDRVKWKIPFSDMPRFGPMSRKGVHSDPEKELFGTSLFPNI